MKRSVVSFAALVALLLVFPTVAQAQMPCSLQTVVGTYAIKGTGEAFVGSGPGPVPYPSIAGALSPVALVGIVQIHPDGAVTGSYWGNAYGQPPRKDENWNGTITMNPSCVGDWSYTVVLPGVPPVPVTEKIVVLDQGKEIRTASMTHPLPFIVWNSTAKRISGSLVKEGICRQDMTRGTWVNVCRGFAHIPTTETVAPMVAVIPLTTDELGQYEGTFNAKLGPVSVALPVEGTMTLQPDCYGEMTVAFPTWGNSGAKGILVGLDEGKELWLMLTKDVAPDGTETTHLPVLCDVLRMNR